MCLGAIFDHPKVMLLRDPQDKIEIGGLAIEMYCNDANGCGGDLFFNQFRIDRKGSIISVTKHHPSAGLGNGFGR